MTSTMSLAARTCSRVVVENKPAISVERPPSHPKHLPEANPAMTVCCRARRIGTEISFIHGSASQIFRCSRLPARNRNRNQSGITIRIRITRTEKADICPSSTSEPWILGQVDSTTWKTKCGTKSETKAVVDPLLNPGLEVALVRVRLTSIGWRWLAGAAVRVPALCGNAAEPRPAGRACRHTGWRG